MTSRIHNLDSQGGRVRISRRTDGVVDPRCDGDGTGGAIDSERRQVRRAVWLAVVDVAAAQRAVELVSILTTTRGVTIAEDHSVKTTGDTQGCT